MPMRLRPGLRAAIVAMLAGASIAGFAFRDDSAPPPAATRHVMLLYVGADDCPPCRAWQAQARATFRASPEFAAVSYREVKSPTVLDVLKDEYWPDELRIYRDRLDRGAGVPLWFIVSDNGTVERSGGISQWESTVLPKLRSLLR
jgi:hypothetical protein